MRKYDKKNKINIGIIVIISIVIIVMFSLVVSFFLSRDRSEYKVAIGSFVFDKDKTIIKLDSEGIIKTKWNKEYYLELDKNQYELGNTAISYNETTGEIKLYGRYYEIGAGDEINITDKETVIKSSALTKFYKLADRKYLVIDKEIKSEDGLLSTTDFLMIELDKIGNATLTNHKVSLKTFAETTIVTSNYTFDIANEILTYGSDKIDLKKVIGSSNEYTKEDLIPEENNNNSTNNGITDITVNNGENTNTSNGGNNNSGGKGESNLTIEEIKKATKRTSVISVTSTTNKINIDYVIYDPKKEYISVYVEIRKEGSQNVDTIYLNSNSTNYELSNLFPNTNYELTFKYSYIDENNNLHSDTFDNITITTKKPNIYLKVTRTSLDKIYYSVTTDDSYKVTSATLIVYANGEEKNRTEVEIDGNTVGYLAINNIAYDELIELKLTNIKSNGIIINGLEASYKFKY